MRIVIAQAPGSATDVISRVVGNRCRGGGWLRDGVDLPDVGGGGVACIAFKNSELGMGQRELRGVPHLRHHIVAGLRSLPGVGCRLPEGTFYAFADVRGLCDLAPGGKRLGTDEAVAFWLLDEAHVAAVPGTPFGAPGYIRFSFATDLATIDGAIEAMRKAIAAAG
mgnify:CR=1 FL=1